MVLTQWSIVQDRVNVLVKIGLSPMGKVSSLTSQYVLTVDSPVKHLG